MPFLLSRRAVTVVAVVAAVTTGVSPALAARPESAGATSPGSVASPAAGTGQVTLITGDTVQVSAAGAGRFSATVQPAPGREHVTFHTLEVDGGLRVLPSDAVPYVSSGALDADLFDVEELIADGYADAAAGSLPLIVRYRDGAGAARVRALAGATSVRPLSSIGGAALSADKDGLAGFWKTTVPAAETRRSAGDARLGQGIETIWLDAKVRPALDRSTAQIGAPQVWKGGHDGSGVTVAVLDTGIDATHPDLSARIRQAQSFTGNPDTSDRHGHGTHVASIIAGSGAASGGTRRGVAPGADLIIGKVLGNDGSGRESWIISAMEWAAAQKATVVNMSLGGEGGDGTDPMSLALDRITAETGTLFVVAAGNQGDDQSVGSPGTARAALTVGAVDRDETLATFSSRGPRPGDEGLKPEITAPGVRIAAARATGTDLGNDLGTTGASYTAISGTSMATPHVAGAVALLAQTHPGWKAARLKDTLISTARTGPDATVYGQGAGRVDVARAVAQQVTATGIADFGLLSDNRTGTAAAAGLTRTITYTNDGTTAVALALKLAVRNLTTGTQGSAAITTPASVTVPAGKSVAVPVTVDPKTLARGQYSGLLTATGAGGVLTTTAVGLTLQGPKHKVTFTALDRAGQRTNVPVLMLHGDSSRSDYYGYILDQAWAEAVVEEGSYLLHALIEDGGQHEQASLITDPELKVTKDIEIVLDARKAGPIRIETPKPSEQQSILSHYVHRTMGSGRTISHGTMHFSGVERVNVTPTKKTAKGSYEFSSRWQLVAPMVQATVDGVRGPIDAGLTRYSPGGNSRRRLPLVFAGKGTPAELAAAKVKGAAVIILSGDDTVGGQGPDETELTAAAAAAGAAITLMVRPASWSAWTSWTPIGERDPIPSLALPLDSGEKLINRTRKGKAVLDLTLTTSSPYLYDVQQVSPGRVPSSITYRVTSANSARITSRYVDNGGLNWAKEQRFGWRPWQTYSWNDASRFVETPKVREEWVTSGDSVWQQRVRHDWPWLDIGAVAGGMTELPRSYRPGRRATTWFAPVVRPASPRGVADLVSTRTGNTLKLRIPEFVDAAGHFTLIGADDTAVELRRDGVVLAQPENALQDVVTTAESAAYRLALTTRRGGEEWTRGTRTDTVWDFRSAAAASSTAVIPLPLLQVDYQAPVDLTGKATAGTHSLGLVLRQQDGLPTPTRTRVTVSISTDEGATWKPAKVTGSGTCYRATVPAGKGTVSLRVKALDGAGNAVEQTVVRAYDRR